MNKIKNNFIDVINPNLISDVNNIQNNYLKLANISENSLSKTIQNETITSLISIEDKIKSNNTLDINDVMINLPKAKYVIFLSNKYFKFFSFSTKSLQSYLIKYNVLCLNYNHKNAILNMIATEKLNNLNRPLQSIMFENNEIDCNVLYKSINFGGTLFVPINDYLNVFIELKIKKIAEIVDKLGGDKIEVIKNNQKNTLKLRFDNSNNLNDICLEYEEFINLINNDKTFKIDNKEFNSMSELQDLVKLRCNKLIPEYEINLMPPIFNNCERNILKKLFKLKIISKNEYINFVSTNTEQNTPIKIKIYFLNIDEEDESKSVTNDIDVNNLIETHKKYSEQYVSTINELKNNLTLLDNTCNEFKFELLAKNEQIEKLFCKINILQTELDEKHKQVEHLFFKINEIQSDLDNKNENIEMLTYDLIISNNKNFELKNQMKNIISKNNSTIDQIEQTDQSEIIEQNDQSEIIEQNDQSEIIEQNDQSEIIEQNDQSEIIEQSEQPKIQKTRGRPGRKKKI
jgi:hypothetical protein